MAAGTWTLLCIAVVLIALIVRRRLRFVAAFRNIAGPPSLPILGNALQLNGTPADFFKLMLEWHKSFGDTFQFWIGLRPFIAMSDPDHIQEILRSFEHIKKNLEYDLLYPFIGTGLVTSSGSKWHTRRKLLTPTFHYGILKEFINPIERHSKILVKVLEKELCNTAGFDIKPYAKMAALDIIGDTAMGYEFNAQENSDFEYIKAIDELTGIMQKRFITPWLKPSFLFNLTTLSKRQNACIDIVHKFSKKVIKERKDNFKLFNNKLSDMNKNEINGKKYNKALLDLLIETGEDGKVLSDEDIQEEVDTFLFAGVDTSSVTLSWIIYVLGKHPQVQDHILEELNKIIPDFSNQKLTVDIINEFHYLDRVIKEVLRLYPPAPFIGRQIYKPVQIDDKHTILPGTSIFINVFALHRNEKYFERPNEFNPDRFLNENKMNRHNYAYIPFSAGPRNCIGQKFAMLVQKIVIATLIKSYKFQSLDSEDKLVMAGEIVLNATKGIRVKIEKRT